MNQPLEAQVISISMTGEKRKGFHELMAAGKYSI